MKFKSTNLVTLSDKKEQLAVRKADLDILSKLNQFSSAVDQTFSAIIKMFDPVIETQTIRANATLGTKTKLLLVDDNSAIQVTVTSGLPIGHEFTIQRISSGLTSNAVTISSSDTFPFTSMFGNTVAKTTRYSETFTFRKVSVNAWGCVSGFDSGVNANGTYELTQSGVMFCNGIASSSTFTSIGTSQYGSTSGTTYGYSATVNTPYASTATANMRVAWSTAYGYVGQHAVTSVSQIVLLVVYGTALAGSANSITWQVKGRWY